MIYYTLDGSTPTQSSTLYTTSIALASVTTLRAAAFTNGWTPSAAVVAYYGYPLAATANVQVTRSINYLNPIAPSVTFNVVPENNTTCFVVNTESLAPDLTATKLMPAAPILPATTSYYGGHTSARTPSH